MNESDIIFINIIVIFKIKVNNKKKTVFIFNLNTNPFELNKLLIAGIYNYYYYYCSLVCIQFMRLVCFIIIISIIIEEEEE
jgi:hypothetical protein